MNGTATGFGVVATNGTRRSQDRTAGRLLELRRKWLRLRRARIDRPSERKSATVTRADRGDDLLGRLRRAGLI